MPVISIETFKRSLQVIHDIASESNQDQIEICFHGGEPLVAGIEFYKNGLKNIRDLFGDSAKLSIQSNLWLLNQDYIHLFNEYKVRIGTSLDGPENINDYQRSNHYYKNTMRGIKLLRENGIEPGCIASFSKNSVEQIEKILEFFISENMPFSVHATVKPINYHDPDDIFMSPEECGDFLVKLLELYLEKSDKIKISTLDAMIKNVSRDESGLCTFSRCIGKYLAFGPEGNLYPCNRFVGDERYSFGSVLSISSISDIHSSSAWKLLNNWQEKVDKACSDCIHQNICHGGCPYSGFASGNGAAEKDPYCESYQKIYKYILDRGSEEFLSKENINIALASNMKEGKGAFFKGTSLLQIMNNEPHPYNQVSEAKRILTVALLGITGDPDRTIDALIELGVTKNSKLLKDNIKRYYKDLIVTTELFNNLYLHITDKCNLNCNHCYAESKNNGDCNLPRDKILNLLMDAKALKFQKSVITGGEPLEYPYFDELSQKIISLRRNDQIGKVFLRTNLTANISDEEIQLFERAFNKIVVSIDGSEKLHDTRRGKGSYQEAISNLKRFNKRYLNSSIQLACILDYNKLNKEQLEIEKEAVFDLGEKLDINDIRFRPLLPIGRANSIETAPPAIENLGVSEWIKWKYYPRTSCGLGQVIMIKPDGDTYPCHVLCKEKNYLGNIFNTSLKEILSSDKFQELKNTGVDSDKKCSNCDLRYLCGGICKIWNNTNCQEFYASTEYLLKDALILLEINYEDFLSVIGTYPTNKSKNT